MRNGQSIHLGMDMISSLYEKFLCLNSLDNEHSLACQKYKNILYTVINVYNL